MSKHDDLEYIDFSGVTELITEVLSEFLFSLPRPFETPYAHIKRVRRGRDLQRKRYTDTIWRLRKRGVVLITHDTKGERFIQLTKKGFLEILFKKALRKRVMDWDGKWRLFMFDIPESSKGVRLRVRKMLARLGFKKMQASVYISPYELNRDAVEYLNQTGLAEYIRIARVEELDDEKEFLKLFKLKR